MLKEKEEKTGKNKNSKKIGIMIAIGTMIVVCIVAGIVATKMFHKKGKADEDLYMIMIVIVACFMVVSLMASIGYTKISLVDVGLRLLGAVFVLLYLNNMVTHVVLPIMDRVFSKGVLYKANVFCI